MSNDIEVFVDFVPGLKRVGTIHRHTRRGGETISFEYHADWLQETERFSLEPALALGRGAFVPPGGAASFGSISDSAPDTWGRRLMQRAERRQAEREDRQARTLMEVDYLLGVSDFVRLGALRFRKTGDQEFQTPMNTGVPALIDLGRLLQVTERVLRDEETDEDIQLIFAPGSSLGGSRPKASVVDQNGRLTIAKFPKETDDYSWELWEAVALNLAARAGIRTSAHELVKVADKPVLLSHRFDRDGGVRIPFLSAMSMMGLKDGERASYPELVDVLTQYGARAAQDAHELFRRMAFNVLVSNVDDHLRNHGFLWVSRAGWTLSPAYDLNPVPSQVRPRILTTNISLDEATCDIDLVLSQAEYFGLGAASAKTIVKEVATATATWQDVAKSLNARVSELRLMAGAFEHADLRKALAL